MSSHHDQDNHSNEVKPVAFGTPLILGLVTLLLILLGVSTCDNKKHGSCEGKEDCSKECAKKCEADSHAEHNTATATHEKEHACEIPEEHGVVADTLAKADTAAVKVEEHAYH